MHGLPRTSTVLIVLGTSKTDGNRRGVTIAGPVSESVRKPHIVPGKTIAVLFTPDSKIRRTSEEEKEAEEHSAPENAVVLLTEVEQVKKFEFTTILPFNR